MKAGKAASGRSMQQRWLDVFADPSGATFRARVAPDVSLAGSAFVRSIVGPLEVWKALRTSADIYDHIEFTHSATEGARTYLEWAASALGLQMAGVTVLSVNDSNLVELVAIHHRPLPAALSFSVEMRRRLVATMDPTFFYPSAIDGY